MNVKNDIQNATDLVNNITPSVVALAVSLGVTPKKLAVSLVDSNGDFLAELAGEVIRLQVAKSKDEAEKNNIKQLVMKA